MKYVSIAARTLVIAALVISIICVSAGYQYKALYFLGIAILMMQLAHSESQQAEHDKMTDRMQDPDWPREIDSPPP